MKAKERAARAEAQRERSRAKRAEQAERDAAVERAHNRPWRRAVRAVKAGVARIPRRAQRIVGYAVAGGIEGAAASTLIDDRLAWWSGLLIGVAGGWTLLATTALAPKLGRRTALGVLGALWALVLGAMAVAIGEETAAIGAVVLCGLAFPVIFWLAGRPWVWAGRLVRWIASRPGSERAAQVAARREASWRQRRLYDRPARRDWAAWLSVAGLAVGLVAALWSVALGAIAMAVGPFVAAVRLLAREPRAGAAGTRSGHVATTRRGARQR